MLVIFSLLPLLFANPVNIAAVEEAAGNLFKKVSENGRTYMKEVTIKGEIVQDGVSHELGKNGRGFWGSTGVFFGGVGAGMMGKAATHSDE